MLATLFVRKSEQVSVIVKKYPRPAISPVAVQVGELRKITEPELSQPAGVDTVFEAETSVAFTLQAEKVHPLLEPGAHESTMKLDTVLRKAAEDIVGAPAGNPAVVNVTATVVGLLKALVAVVHISCTVNDKSVLEESPVAVHVVTVREVKAVAKHPEILPDDTNHEEKTQLLGAPGSHDRMTCVEGTGPDTAVRLVGTVAEATPFSIRTMRTSMSPPVARSSKSAEFE